MLHSYKYTFEGTTYMASKPYWADARALDAQHPQNIEEPISSSSY
jgi:hypothetical protein